MHHKKINEADILIPVGQYTRTKDNQVEFKVRTEDLGFLWPLKLYMADTVSLYLKNKGIDTQNSSCPSFTIAPDCYKIRKIKDGLYAITVTMNKEMIETALRNNCVTGPRPPLRIAS